MNNCYFNGTFSVPNDSENTYSGFLFNNSGTVEIKQCLSDFSVKGNNDGEVNRITQKNFTAVGNSNESLNSCYYGPNTGDTTQGISMSEEVLQSAESA